jgi:hypothetical protein
VRHNAFEAVLVSRACFHFLEEETSKTSKMQRFNAAFGTAVSMVFG